MDKKYLFMGSIMRRLPPLNALRAFEAGARHLSFTKAAQELHVTQAAVSHQVRQLEEHLGVALFRRYTRRLALTEEGRALLPAVGEAFDRIDQAVRDLGEGSGNRLLTVSLTHSFAGKWLVPRLGRFRQQHPEVDLRLHHSAQPADFTRDDVDLAVRWGRGGWPNLGIDFLKAEAISPVCSPKLLEGPHPLRKPADLRHHSLLHDYDYDDWFAWLRAAGVQDVEAYRGPILDETNVLIQAALEGQGVALTDLALVADDLAAGRLVRPFDLTLASDYGYYIVYPSGALKRPKVKAFRDFLLAEAAAEQEREAGRRG